MKRIIFLLFVPALVIVYLSCKKGASNDFSVTGFSDVSISKLDTFSIPLQIKKTSGDPGTVSLAITNLPPGVTAYFSTASGAPDYSTTLKIYADNNAAEITSSITLSASSTNAGSKTYTSHLIVAPAVDCETQLVRSYTTFDSCSPRMPVIGYTQTISKSSTRNRINIANFANTGSTIYADLDCFRGTVTIPSQVLGAYTISGGGPFYNADSMVITYTAAGPSPHACTMHMK